MRHSGTALRSAPPAVPLLHLHLPRPAVPFLSAGSAATLLYSAAALLCSLSMFYSAAAFLCSLFMLTRSCPCVSCVPMPSYAGLTVVLACVQADGVHGWGSLPPVHSSLPSFGQRHSLGRSAAAVAHACACLAYHGLPSLQPPSRTATAQRLSPYQQPLRMHVRATSSAATPRGRCPLRPAILPAVQLPCVANYCPPVKPSSFFPAPLLNLLAAAHPPPFFPPLPLVASASPWHISNDPPLCRSVLLARACTSSRLALPSRRLPSVSCLQHHTHLLRPLSRPQAGPGRLSITLFDQLSCLTRLPAQRATSPTPSCFAQPSFNTPPSTSHPPSLCCRHPQPMMRPRGRLRASVCWHGAEEALSASTALHPRDRPFIRPSIDPSIRASITKF